MNFNNRERFTFGDITEIIFSGGTPSTRVDKYWGGDINWLSSGETRNNFINTTEKTITKEGVKNSSTRLAKKGDIVMASAGQGFTRGQVSYLHIDTYINQSIIAIRPNPNILNNLYAYYNLKNRYEELRAMSDGHSIRGSITIPMIKELEIDLPPILEQKEVANILHSLDKKIEINNKINFNLEELAQTLYKHWFVDFEFPNEEGLPYKSSGGEMVDSELGNIPEGWIIYNQGDFSPVITGKKNANIAISNGDYKFFTCGQEPLLTDDFSFDAEAILVAGNGDFNVKYYRGKFEAYQRTYVLIPHISKLTPLLYFSIKNNLNEITKGHRGSVIKFITKGDLENYKLALPIKEKLLALSSVFTTILNKITTIKEENEKLANIRDLLLPKLMSGEIRVPVEE